MDGRPSIRDGPPAPRISVIIPTLSEESELPGLLAQLTPLRVLHRLEIIVSDGGSTDRTLELARGSADRVVTARAGERQTIAAGRNAGADAASAAILLFLNADITIVGPDRFFTEIVRRFEDPDVVAAGCSVSVDAERETLFDSAFHGAFNLWCRALNGAGIGMGRGECQAVRTSAFRAVGGYDGSLAAAEDFDLFRRLRRLRPAGRIVFLREGRVTESPRRYRQWGYARVVGAWALNACSVMVAGKAAARDWRPVR